MLTTFINALMSAEADAVCGAEYGARSEARSNSRNGYRHRDFDTRIGTLEVAIPKLRQGSYFPDWLLERRRRAEAALPALAGAQVGDVTDELRSGGRLEDAQSCQPDLPPDTPVVILTVMDVFPSGPLPPPGPAPDTDRPDPGRLARTVTGKPAGRFPACRSEGG